MKRIVLLIALFGATVSASYGQGFDRSRLEVGGSVGLQFGDYTLVNVAPQLGYRLNPYVTVGAGASYTYYKDEYYIDGRSFDYKTSYFGMNVFGRFYPIEYVVLSVQPEANRMWRTYDIPGGKEKVSEFVPSVLLGGGVRLGPVTAMIQYDVIQDKNSPYSDNIFYSVGYTFSF